MTPDTGERIYVSVRLAARRASVAESTIRRWQREGLLTRYRRGPLRREVLVDAGQLTDLLRVVEDIAD